MTNFNSWMLPMPETCLHDIASDPETSAEEDFEEDVDVDGAISIEDDEDGVTHYSPDELEVLLEGE